MCSCRNSILFHNFCFPLIPWLSLSCLLPSRSLPCCILISRPFLLIPLQTNSVCVQESDAETVLALSAPSPPLPAPSQYYQSYPRHKPQALTRRGSRSAGRASGALPGAGPRGGGPCMGARTGGPCMGACMGGRIPGRIAPCGGPCGGAYGGAYGGACGGPCSGACG